MKIQKNNYITPPGFEKLQNELQNLLRKERPEVTKLVQWAASNGDRSENADYIYGKKRLREIDRRIRFLSQRIEMAIVIDPSKINSEKVQFGATIKILDETGLEKKFTIVGVDEVNTTQGLISWQSPIGKALIGKECGDEVLIKVPAGELTFEIISIDYCSIVIQK
jgi:transcription elongation factor GreB